MENVLKEKNYEIERAYIFSEGNVEIKDQKIYMPIYMIMFLNEYRIRKYYLQDRFKWFIKLFL